MEFGLDESRRADGTVVVTVRGELDLATAPELVACLDGLGGAPALLIDLTPATFLDSSGLRHLLRASRGTAGSLTLVCPPANRPVRMVMELYGLDKAVTVVDELPPG